MPITTFSSHAFSQDTGGAKRAAQHGPVFITDKGKPAHVLLTIEEYRRLVGEHDSIVEALGMADGADFEFEPPRLQGPLSRPADLS